jgi:hypothetical protein
VLALSRLISEHWLELPQLGRRFVDRCDVFPVALGVESIYLNRMKRILLILPKVSGPLKVPAALDTSAPVNVSVPLWVLGPPVNAVGAVTINEGPEIVCGPVPFCNTAFGWLVAIAHEPAWGMVAVPVCGAEKSSGLTRFQAYDPSRGLPLRLTIRIFYSS